MKTIKRWLMERITRMCNLQRDRYLNPPVKNKKAVRKGSGFRDILEAEQKKRREGAIDLQKTV